MDPKSGLRPYLQRDVDDILDALVDHEGNVASQITIVVNGRERLVNVGLLSNTAKFIWGRAESTSMQDTVEEICRTAFDEFTAPADLVSGLEPCPRRLVRAGLTKRNLTLVASLVYRSHIGGKLIGEETNHYYIVDMLTKYQQTYMMHLLLAHGQGGHVGQGMASWDLYVNTVSGENRFELQE